MTHLHFTEHGPKFSELPAGLPKDFSLCTAPVGDSSHDLIRMMPSRESKQSEKNGTYRSCELREGFLIFYLPRLKVHHICIMTKFPSPIEDLNLCYLLGVKQRFLTHLNTIRVRVWMLEFLIPFPEKFFCVFSMCLLSCRLQDPKTCWNYNALTHCV